MKARRSLRDRVHGSIMAKSLLMLAGTILLTCLMSYALIFVTMRGVMYDRAMQLVERRATYIQTMLEHTDLSLDMVVGLYRKNIGYIELAGTYRELPPLQRVVVESDIRDGQLYFSADKDLPVGVFRAEGQYVVVSPNIYDMESDAVKSIVLHTLFVCAGVALLCTALTVGYSVRPLRRLNRAISKVAEGDFSVRVDFYKRKEPAHEKDELERIVDNFNEMTQRLGGVEYLRRDFVSNVSHEFKTPLAAIQGSARMLADTPYDRLGEARVQKYARLILNESARLGSLSSNLLRLSRLEQEQMLTARKRVRVDEQLRRSILTLEAQWVARGLEWEIELDACEVDGDEELLDQVWLNLLSNAVKFTEPGGQVTVGVYARRRKVTVEIADNGIGMDEQTLERVFEKFYQGDSSHSAEGAGLGLSIVKRIVDLHGGHIGYESKPGAGTRCVVTLPEAAVTGA